MENFCVVFFGRIVEVLMAKCLVYPKSKLMCFLMKIHQRIQLFLLTKYQD